VASRLQFVLLTRGVFGSPVMANMEAQLENLAAGLAQLNETVSLLNTTWPEAAGSLNSLGDLTLGILPGALDVNNGGWGLITCMSRPRTFLLPSRPLLLIAPCYYTHVQHSQGAFPLLPALPLTARVCTGY
jgi:hypothetical protein